MKQETQTTEEIEAAGSGVQTNLQAKYQIHTYEALTASGDNTVIVLAHTDSSTGISQEYDYYDDNTTDFKFGAIRNVTTTFNDKPTSEEYSYTMTIAPCR